MKLLKILLFLSLAGAVWGQDCPMNSHWEDCGSLCSPTCSDPSPDLDDCMMVCVTGCLCDDGYISLEPINIFGGVTECVLIEDCPITVTDYDGNVYGTVLIGDQLWMAENLKTTHYNNGYAIPNITDNGNWNGL